MVYRPTDRIWTAAALTTCPVATLDLKAHLRRDGSEEDTLILATGIAATAMVEAYTQRLLTSRACVLRLNALPAGQEPIELPGGDVTSITSVLVDGVAVTGSTFVGRSPALLIPAADWGSVVAKNYGVVISYVAGFAAVPFDLQQAIKLIAGDLDWQRMNEAEGKWGPVWSSAENFMKRHRIWPNL